ncbi:hypothetical protein PFICI_05585 [Pestalotiopsis fici W106-1]|uniref:Uncharacterized protein n=1 Tax=Pestalotiopsis fici (strain W106-1 / CGMCC3.15140) TaxID=1229662 RepID=W3XCG5_PESFW|nr:uncharacterized protein PFICI_05585 [Pestalotiopsis fici W106-1]ETS83709.1 hypothetical protein PFICI_05585 [Pestalotiopsis fici W106-1]
MQDTQKSQAVDGLNDFTTYHRAPKPTPRSTTSTASTANLFHSGTHSLFFQVFDGLTAGFPGTG